MILASAALPRYMYGCRRQLSNVAFNALYNVNGQLKTGTDQNFANTMNVNKQTETLKKRTK